MECDTKIILEKLDEIKSELDFIKEHMLDVDTVLMGDDIKALQDAEKDLNEGKTKRIN